MHWVQFVKHGTYARLSATGIPVIITRNSAEKKVELAERFKTVVH